MRIVATLCSLLVCFPVYAKPPNDGDAAAGASAPVPMRLLQGYIVLLPGRIGRANHLQFFVDTGLTRTIVSRDLLSKLETPAVRAEDSTVLSFNERVAVQTSEINDLEIGPVRIPNLTVTVGDLGYFRSFSEHVDGVIGLDVLSRTSFSIDFAARRVIFGADSTSLAHQKGKMHSANLRSQPGYFSVELQTEGRPLELAVDTGVGGILLYEDRLPNHGIDYRLIDNAMGMRLGGILRMNIAVVDRIAIGGQWLDRRVALTPAPLGEVYRRLDGFFGVACLNAQRVNFNFEEGTLTWWN